jgi:hypothetical protein
MGLNMTVMSYRDHVDFGLVGDRNLVGDLWPMMAGLEASLDELVEVICKRRRPKKTAAKRGTHSGNGKPVGAPA